MSTSTSDQSANLISPASTEPDAKRPRHHASTSPADTSASSAGQPDQSSRYWQRRRKNNEAAKKCRANRKSLVENRQRRSDALEVENAALRDQVR